MITIDKYTVLEIDEWNGTYSLTQGFVNKNGEFKPNFVTEKWGKKGEEVDKVLPKRIRLGDAATALQVADAIYAYFGATKEAPPPQLPEGDDVPF